MADDWDTSQIGVTSIGSGLNGSEPSSEPVLELACGDAGVLGRDVVDWAADRVADGAGVVGLVPVPEPVPDPVPVDGAVVEGVVGAGVLVPGWAGPAVPDWVGAVVGVVGVPSVGPVVGDTGGVVCGVSGTKGISYAGRLSLAGGLWWVEGAGSVRVRYL